MNDRYYILNDAGEPVAASDLHHMAAWLDAHRDRRRAATDMIGEAKVSTVFLGFDHGWEGEPVLWETMVFGGPLDQEQDRCSGSREQALAMHAAMVERVKAAV